MKRLTDLSGIILQQKLKAALANHDVVIAKNNKGETYALSTTCVKQELIPFLRYGMAKLGNIVALYTGGEQIFSVENGIMYV